MQRFLNNGWESTIGETMGDPGEVLKKMEEYVKAKTKQQEALERVERGEVEEDVATQRSKALGKAKSELESAKQGLNEEEKELLEKYAKRQKRQDTLRQVDLGDLLD